MVGLGQWASDSLAVYTVHQGDAGREETWSGDSADPKRPISPNQD